MRVNIIVNFFLARWLRHKYWAIGLLGILFCQQSFALPLIPMTYSGSVSYNYGYSKAERAENETTTLSTTIAGTGFIWQPWFVTLGVGLSVGLSESNSNTSGSGSASTVTSGNLQFTLFPQSRFPFVLSLSRTDSRLENTGTSFSADSHTVNTRIYLSQTYYGRSGYIVRVSWDHNKLDSERSISKNDSINASFRGRHAKHSYSANAGYNRSERSNSPLKPSNSRIEVQHNYIPSTELGLSSTGSYTRNDSGQSGNTAIFENVQVSSVFGWRPIDRPYTITGGARIASADSGSGVESKSMSTNVGASYQFTRSLRALASALVNVAETAGSKVVSSSESASINYFSQQFFIGGFSWNWNSALGFSNSNNDINGVKDSQQNGTLSLGHSFNRIWAIGRVSTFNFAFTENGSISKSSEQDEPNYGVGHGLGFGWSRRTATSGSFANVSISDSRTTGENSTTFQQLSAQITQRNTLSRVSSLSANVGYQASRQELSEAEGESSNPETLYANATYTNSRMFGIYPLRFSTALSYNKRLAGGGNDSARILSENRLDYRIGLLTTALSFRIMQVEGGTTSETLNFTVTRSF